MKTKKPFDKAAFVKQVLRRGSYKLPSRNQAMINARVSRGLYRCAMCPPDKLHDRHSVHVDHVEPVVDPLKGFTGWDDYVERMYPEVEGFAILCIDHHMEKTKGENEVRRKTRAEALGERKEKKIKAKKKKNPHLGQSLDQFMEDFGIKIEKKTKKKL